MHTAAYQANQHMVDRLIAEGALWSPPLIAVFRATPRHMFLARVFVFQRKHGRWRKVRLDFRNPDHLRLTYSDRALIIRLGHAGRGQTPVPISSSSQPSLMAQMLEDLKLSSGLSVLEVGVGTGYNAALLAGAVAGRVISVDVDRDVLAEARENLKAFSDRSVEVHHADGRHGFPETAPYDRITVTAATSDLEPAWIEQLADRGLLQAPLALAPGLAFVVRGSVTEGVFHGRLTRAAYFMPLRAEHEIDPSEVGSTAVADDLRCLPSPWAAWFERRPRSSWLAFSHSLAFYGWLRGLTVSYRALADGQPVFAVSDPAGGAVCWLGPQEWQVTCDAGRDLGWSLWRAFLDAGGPWPSEFRLRASPRGNLTPRRPISFLRKGPSCQQVWELIEPRDRPAWI